MAYGSFAYYYDRLMEDTPYAEWIRFAEEIWSLYGKPRIVADLGCGTGNIAIPLAQSGLRVIGVDLSESMLAVAREKSDRLPKGTGGFIPQGQITWVQQDMREFQLPEPVDCIVSFCDCMNYLLEEDDIVRTIGRVYEHLPPGGLFLFDVHTPFQLKNYADQQPFVLNEDDIAYMWTCELDDERCEISHDLTIFVREREWEKERSTSRTQSVGLPAPASGNCFHRIEETHFQRAYSLDWLEAALRQAGFAEVDRFADFTTKSPDETTERAFFAARKQ